MKNPSLLMGATVALTLTASLLTGCDNRKTDNVPARSSANESAPPALMHAALSDKDAEQGGFLRVANHAASDALGAHDRRFLKEAAAGGMFEVQAGELGSSMATDPGVKSFAQMLATDHSKANDELKQLANTKQVDLDDSLPADMRRQLDMLKKKSGKDFDRAFIQQVGIKDHEKDIKQFEKASKDAKDSDVRAWAAKTLPNLRHHQDEAKRLLSNLR